MNRNKWVLFFILLMAGSVHAQAKNVKNIFFEEDETAGCSELETFASKALAARDNGASMWVLLKAQKKLPPVYQYQESTTEKNTTYEIDDPNSDHYRSAQAELIRWAYQPGVNFDQEDFESLGSEGHKIIHHLCIKYRLYENLKL